MNTAPAVQAAARTTYPTSKAMAEAMVAEILKHDNLQDRYEAIIAASSGFYTVGLSWDYYSAFKKNALPPPPRYWRGYKFHEVRFFLAKVAMVLEQVMDKQQPSFARSVFRISYWENFPGSELGDPSTRRTLIIAGKRVREVAGYGSGNFGMPHE